MTNVDRLIERQYELYGIISRTITNLNKIGSAKLNRGVVQSRLGALKSNWAKFQEHHEDLYTIRTDADKKLGYFSDNLYAMCEEVYLDAHATMLDYLDHFDRQVRQNTSSAETSNTSLSASHSRRLPRIDLPKFSGEYSEWSHFRDLFTSMITENDGLSAVEKLHYLKMSVSGEPSQLLKNIAISGENFVRAWDTLAARYENKRILIDAQLSALFGTRKIKTECANDLKRLLGDVKEALAALEALGCPVKHWDPIVVFMLVRKLDTESLKDWEKTLGASSNPPSFNELDTFLVNRIHTLDALERSVTARRSQQPNSNPIRVSPSTRAHTTTVPEQRCSFCSANHYISSCAKFLDQTPEQRRAFVVSKKLCFNCLGPHSVKSCRTHKRCRICNQQHHSTLHASPRDSTALAFSTSTSEAPSASASVSHRSIASGGHVAPPLDSTQLSTPEAHSLLAHSRPIRSAPVLLATALINVVSRFGERHKIRALLDQGSEVSFVSESIAQLLKLPRRSAAIPIIGIGAQRSSVSNGVVSLKIGSTINSTVALDIEALVLPKLTAYLPPMHIKFDDWPHLRNLPLADPHFTTPGKIDAILGAGVYAQIIEDGIRRGQTDAPIAQKTTLGWVLSGSLPNAPPNPDRNQNAPVRGLQCSLDRELLDLLRSFWTLEETPATLKSPLTPDESQCEAHFLTTHSRDRDGRFVVRLPMKNSVSEFGDSRTPALKALFRLEKRFDAKPSLKNAYLNFLREYRELNHMQLCESRAQSTSLEFYLPHHGVVRESSSTTKLRVVFNGSQKTNRGLSLNDCLHIGPKLQNDLIDILLRWRRDQFVFAADIEKMYRQIRVHEDDQPLQKILWRNSPLDALQEYKLCTVTYGLACAPYLALRCLQQLATEFEADYPLASEIIRRDTYVDDVLSGASDVRTAQQKIRQLQVVLMAGEFKLRKWISNQPELLSGMPSQDLEQSATLLVEDKSILHTLGIQWNGRTDSFIVSASKSPISNDVVSKRSVLSFIARIFDPLGWAAPIIILAKMFLQELWAIRLDWDEELPENLQSRWTHFARQCENMASLSVPRWFGTAASNRAVEIHGFSDASQKAIAAVIYLRVLTDSNSRRVTLLAAKTKVDPLKGTTIPRLELSAAVLLVRLVIKICEALDFQQVPIHLWTDSTVALTWIKGHPSRWKDFVRNRVSFIQDLSNSRWHHVSGKENPADLASRGLSPLRLQQEQLWWVGPNWLQDHSTPWPSFTPPISSEADVEARSVICAASLSHSDSEIWDLISRYSSLTRLLRITCWLLRAVSRFQKTPSSLSFKDPLTPEELEFNLLFWTRHTQRVHFHTEIRALQLRKPLPSSSALLRLAPFLDPDGLLRLRGRLHLSQLTSDGKHPLILPRVSQFTKLVINHHHRRTLHGFVEAP